MPYLLTLLLSLVAAAPQHDYHISKTNLRYVADREQVQVEMHLFVEDLEKDMATLGVDETLELGTKIQHPEAEEHLKSYLKQHFRVDWNGDRLPLEVIGYELADDLHGFWVYLASNDTPPPTKVTVNCSLLTETYPDQKNIVKIFNGEERGATLLMSRERTTGSYSAK